MYQDKIELSSENSEVLSYVIMPQHSLNLSSLFYLRNWQLSEASVYSLGIQLIDVLELIHTTGYIFNDLKLENLLLDYDSAVEHFQSTDEDIFQKNKVQVIDFGNATRFIDESTEQHVEKYRVNVFKGNIEFASSNQLNFCTTSRRDDLISLFYLLVFILKHGKMPNVSINYDGDKNKEFKKMIDVRMSELPEDLCF